MNLLLPVSPLVLGVALALCAPGVVGNEHGLSDRPSVVRIPQAALGHQRAVEELLAEGSQLEQEGRWADALNHYEGGVRKYRDAELSRRLEFVRCRYDLERRYADESFVRTVRRSSERQSMNVLAEVLLKIDAYHVDRPEWGTIINRGADSLYYAFDDPAFVEANRLDVSPRRLTAMRHEIERMMGQRAIRSRQDVQEHVSDIAHVFEQRWGLPASSTIYEFTCGALSSLDWYSAFLTADQYNDVISQIDGNFVGLGIELQPRPDHLYVVSVIPTGPAGLAGLRAGEKILQVDRSRVAGLGGEKAADLLRGPENSFVSLSIEDENGQIRGIRVQRKQVEIPSIEEVRIVESEHGVGYIRLSNFQRNTLEEFRSALWQLHREGLQSLIVDVRGNPGGLLDASVDVANLFISNGTIVSTRGRNPNEDRVRHARIDGTWRVPLTVLIDGDSASASEIFAGAIRDNNRGVLVGERTYGKGSVQGIFPLNSEEGGLRLTTAKFYSPTGTAISQRGVDPNVTVQLSRRVDTSGQATTEETEDTILRMGIQSAVDQLRR